jgi:hypothetical protein
MQQLGGSFGAAVVAVVLQRQLAGHSTGTANAHTFWWAIAFTPAQPAAGRCPSEGP